VRETLCWVPWIKLTSITVIEFSPWLRLAPYKRPSRVDVSFHSPEDGNITSFRNIVYSSYLEFRTMDKVRKTSDSQCCTPKSEPFRFYSVFSYCNFSQCFFWLRRIYPVLLLRKFTARNKFFSRGTLLSGAPCGLVKGLQMFPWNVTPLNVGPWSNLWNDSPSSCAYPLLLADSFFIFLLDPEDGGGTFLRSIYKPLPQHIVSDQRR
jgi:hypothetical protein